MATYTPPLGDDVDFSLLSTYTAPAGNDVDFALGESSTDFISDLALITCTASVSGGAAIDVVVAGTMASTDSVSGGWDQSFYFEGLITSNDVVVGAHAIDVATAISPMVSTGYMFSSVTVPQIGLQREKASMLGGFEIDVRSTVDVVLSTESVSGTVQIDVNAGEPIQSTDSVLGTVQIDVVHSAEIVESLDTVLGTAQIDVITPVSVLSTSCSILGGFAIDAAITGLIGSEDAIIGGYQIDVAVTPDVVASADTVLGGVEVTNLSILNPETPGALSQTEEKTGWGVTSAKYGLSTNQKLAYSATMALWAKSMTAEIRPNCKTIHNPQGVGL